MAQLQSLPALFKKRDVALESAITEWAAINLSPTQANELIALLRNSQAAPDVQSEIAMLAELTQPAS